MPKTNLHQHIFIDALPSKVWKVLTGCEYITQYLLDGNVHSHFTEGSLITSKQQAGDIETLNRGKVLQSVPGVLLKYKLFEDAPDSFTTITYEIIPAEDGIELKLRIEGFTDTDEDYFARLKDTKLLLQKIKWLAEYA